MTSWHIFADAVADGGVGCVHIVGSVVVVGLGVWYPIGYGVGAGGTGSCFCCCVSSLLIKIEINNNNNNKFCQKLLKIQPKMIQNKQKHTQKLET